MKLKKYQIEINRTTATFLCMYVFGYNPFSSFDEKAISSLLYLRRLLQLFMTLFPLGIWSFYLFSTLEHFSLKSDGHLKLLLC